VHIHDQDALAQAATSISEPPLMKKDTPSSSSSWVRKESAITAQQSPFHRYKSSLRFTPWVDVSELTNQRLLNSSGQSALSSWVRNESAITAQPSPFHRYKSSLRFTPWVDVSELTNQRLLNSSGQSALAKFSVSKKQKHGAFTLF
jgi:hypothetical protein